MQELVKRIIVLCYVLINVMAQAQEFAPDLDMVKQNEFTERAQRTVWPAADFMRTNRIAWSEIPSTNMAVLSQMLYTIIAPGYQPPHNAITQESVIPCSHFYGGHDCMLFKYSTSSGDRIDVQFGNMLNLILKPKEASRVTEDKIADYVNETAHKFLDLPKDVKNGPCMERFTSVAYSGHGARSGTFRWTGDSLLNAHWYSYMWWWSDGRVILFEIERLDRVSPDINDVNIESRPRDYIFKFSNPAEYKPLRIYTVEIDGKKVPRSEAVWILSEMLLSKDERKVKSVLDARSYADLIDRTTGELPPQLFDALVTSYKNQPDIPRVAGGDDQRMYMELSKCRILALLTVGTRSAKGQKFLDEVLAGKDAGIIPLAEELKRGMNRQPKRSGSRNDKP